MRVTSIRGRFVVGIDGHDRCLVPVEEVVFRDEIILYVGRRYPGPGDRRIEAGNAVIGAGFIDLEALTAPPFRTVSEISAAAPGASGAI
jgi:cytosine/adenosine deaminase-related metal-dependent hydrolase